MAYEAATANIYDLYCGDRTPEVEQWVRYAGPAPARLLEPMCGTAEVAFLLAEQGYEVTGVDLSAPMLTIAEARRSGVPAEVSQRVTLIEGDICRVDLPAGYFDLAHVGHGSWNLLTDGDLRVSALRAIRRSLRPGGRLVLADLFSPFSTSGCSEPRTFQPFRPTPHGLSVAKRSYMERDAERQVVQIHEELCVNGAVTEHHLTLQILAPKELEAEFVQAGFTTVDFLESPSLTAIATA